MMPVLTTFRSKFGLNFSNNLAIVIIFSNTNTLKHPVQTWMLKGMPVTTQLFFISETFTV